MSLSLEEPVRLGILTQMQALRYIGNKIRGRTGSGGSGGGVVVNNGGGARSKDFGGSSFQRKPISVEDEARDVLANVVLSHIPVPQFNFRANVFTSDISFVEN